METKTLTAEPLGLVTAPNLIGQYPDGACLVASGVVHRSAGTCETAPSFDPAWTIDAGSPVLRAVVIPTPKSTLVLVSIAAGWRHCWVDSAGTVGPLEVASCAYSASVNYEVDGVVDWTFTRDRVFVTSTVGVMVFDYIEPATAAQRAPRLAGMFTPALHANAVYGAGKSALKVGYHTHCVMVVTRHFPDCYEITGAPSAAHQVIAISGDANVQMQVVQRPGHPQLEPGDEVEVYRAIQVRAPVLTPQYDQGISTESVYYLSSTFTVPTPAGASFYQWEEATGDQNLGEALYTNSAIVGASAQKRPPPIARVIEEFRNYTFYFNITEPAARVARVGAGLGTLPDTYSQTWGVGTRPGPAYDTFEVNGISQRLANADDLAATNRVNVDDLSRVNPDVESITSIPATGFGFRFDYAGAGDFTLRASNGQNFQPPLPTLAETPETVTRPRRENGFAWTEEAQPEAVTQYGIMSSGTVYCAIATSQALIVFTSEGLFRLTGTGGSTSSGFDWAQEKVDSQVMLRGPNAACRLGDFVYAATNNGMLAIDPSGQVQEISTSALGVTGAKRAYTNTDRTCVVADSATGDVYFSLDDGERELPYVYSSRYNKWSRVRVAPDSSVVGASSLKTGMVWLHTAGNTLTARTKSTTAYQQSVVRFQPFFAGNVPALKRWIAVEWYFSGAAFGAPITVLLNSLTGYTRALKEHKGAVAPTFVQAGLPTASQGSAPAFSLAQTWMEVPRAAPAISNSISIGYTTPAGATKYVFFGLSVTSAENANTVRGRKET